ncbi:Tartrate-resistant acid phosphatase type 5 [Caenorhabditis elegans]|uniref:Tartrate-resistant acid phosphatase type 5 n=1 Tax=Caenorhabditis elegans TaxID=6239 RepID=O01320_CAEEL|nr:Tartrate-resistant acid phosphatase type 5 [Caenorhabditis elegans]CAB04053.1 Tartrate-resistant acid phosphatase type 5 [Caenorhabditis elegans]|eukprot:NP_492283.1 Uncharacterized protein CELE_F02E9.7 [Caenorhabditis elegans]
MLLVDEKLEKRSSSSSLDRFLPDLPQKVKSRRKMRKIMCFVGLFGISTIFFIAVSNISSSEDVPLYNGNIYDPERDSKSFRILLVGDTGGIPILETTWAQNEVKQTMASLADEHSVQMILNMGDNIYFTGPTDEFDPRFESRFENVYTNPSLQVPWLTIAGNHDHFGNVTAEIEYTKHSKKWYFPSLYYKKSVEFNGTSIDFLMIDTISLCGNTKDIQNAGFIEMLRNESHDPRGPVNITAAEEQWAWLENNLEASSAQYLIISGHYPVHSMSSHGPTDCLRQRLDPLLKRFNVNAYFSGHDHSLQHFTFPGYGEHIINYVVSGAASRADASTKHIKEFSRDTLKFNYPEKSWFSWSPVSQLGFRKGGLIYAEFGHYNARLDFFDKRGKQLYSTIIPTRVIPTDTSTRSTASPFVEIGM